MDNIAAVVHALYGTVRLAPTGMQRLHGNRKNVLERSRTRIFRTPCTPLQNISSVRYQLPLIPPIQVLLILGLGALWLFLSEYPHGPLARFLVGAFPREMETLGLYKQGGKVVRDAIAADVGRPD